ncbi:uncharacterized protein [Amphiura filiformis]|uniref:uncharacterized protein n=1 Tax=Amphiura filiformis TaxID=82378 RepID=UPI003B21ADF2
MFRLLQGFPRALRNTIQAGHYRTPAATPQSNHQDNENSLLPTSLIIHNHGFNSIHTSSITDSHHRGSTQQDDWKSTRKHDYWHSFRGTHNHFEAVGWGTAIIISLQLCRGLSTFTHSDSNNRRRNGPKAMLTSIAHAMPMLEGHMPSLSMKVVDEKLTEEPRKTKPTSQHQFDAKKNFETSEELEEACQKLRSVSDESIGMAHNAIGLQKARQGHLAIAAQHFLKGSLLGYSKAKFNMAVCYEQGRGVNQNFTKAVELYNEAASQGHAMSQYNLGVFYLVGIGDAELNPQKAIELITTAANQGLTQAQTYLGAYYLQDPHQDTKKAVDLLKQAAQKHDKEALFHLGVCYQYGLGIESNTAKAASYYHQSASMGYIPAVYSLGTFYEEGLGGLPVNLQEAKELYQYASQNDCKEARIRLIQLREKEIAAQKQSQRQVMSKRTKKQSTIKRSKTAISIHTSASAPALSTIVTDNNVDMVQNSKSAAIADQLSYLSLFMPYFYNIGNRIKDSSSIEEKRPVVFQVGEEMDDAEFADGYEQVGVKQVSHNMNSRMSSLLTVS